MQLLAIIHAVLLAVCTAQPSTPSCPAPLAGPSFPPTLRIACGTSERNVPLTAELCEARGCCWDSMRTLDTPPPPPKQHVHDSCISGVLHTPAGGVKNVGTWKQHVEYANEEGWQLQLEVAGYVHDGHQGGPGPCCGNTFNLTAQNVNNIGFDVVVERTCPGMPAGVR